jgi:hypothetical protein
MVSLDLVLLPCQSNQWNQLYPINGFGVPDIYVEQRKKEEDTDRLFFDSEGDYVEETCVTCISSTSGNHGKLTHTVV